MKSTTFERTKDKTWFPFPPQKKFWDLTLSNIPPKTPPAPSAPPAQPAPPASPEPAQAYTLIFIPAYGCFRLEQQLLEQKLRVFVCSELL